MITAKLDVVNHLDIQKSGLAALKDALGITGAVRFLEQFDNGGSWRLHCRKVCGRGK